MPKVNRHAGKVRNVWNTGCVCLLYRPCMVDIVLIEVRSYGKCSFLAWNDVVYIGGEVAGTVLWTISDE